MNQLKTLIDEAGGPDAVGKICCISGRAVYKWTQRGAMPRTEYTQETRYADLIEQATGGRVKASELLEAGSRKQAA